MLTLTPAAAAKKTGLVVARRHGATTNFVISLTTQTDRFNPWEKIGLVPSPYTDFVESRFREVWRRGGRSQCRLPQNDRAPSANRAEARPSSIGEMITWPAAGAT